MNRFITVLGNDPSLTSWGMALVDVDVETMEMHPRRIDLCRTEKSKNKSVRVSSDYLARARELRGKFVLMEDLCHIHAAEIPSGAQSAKASYAFGLVVGVLSAHRKPLIEVSPTEVKRAVTGYAGATKQEMIEWATETFPDLDWVPGKGSKQWADVNEHMADALGIVLAATKTQQFAAAAAMSQAASAA